MSQRGWRVVKHNRKKDESDWPPFVLGHWERVLAPVGQLYPRWVLTVKRYQPTPHAVFDPEGGLRISIAFIGKQGWAPEHHMVTLPPTLLIYLSQFLEDTHLELVREGVAKLA